MKHSTIKIQEILKFLALVFIVYSVIILVFAWLYYRTESIGFFHRPTGVMEKISFEKAIYFSVVSFHTIGYGDIYPVSAAGRIILMCQSFLSMFFTAVFSGFLVYLAIRRPNDIIATKQAYIRHRSGNYFLSLRLGNKGRAIIDLKSKFEAWTIVNNSRIRAFRHEQELPDLERILYYDINLDYPENEKLKHALQDALHNKIRLHMKFSFIGNDIKSGEQVAYACYYDSTELAFGRTFMNVYSWDENGHRKDFRWKNFERIEELEEGKRKAFLQQ